MRARVPERGRVHVDEPDGLGVGREALGDLLRPRGEEGRELRDEGGGGGLFAGPAGLVGAGGDDDGGEVADELAVDLGREERVLVEEALGQPFWFFSWGVRFKECTRRIPKWMRKC